MTDEMGFDLKLPAVGELTFPQWQDWLVHYNAVLGERERRIKLLEKHMQLIITRTKYRGGSFDNDMPDVVCAIARDALEGKER
jgi:hypothetical protein